ncbi:MAG: G5 domain-containing protein [Clostridia bacterium]|nr:G5 domain-containing protein [Clostridia bacterium]
MKNVKIICVSLILLMLSGVGVMAVTTQRSNVKITLANGYEMTVLTSKTKVSDILAENGIILAEDEKATPSVEDELTEGKTISITSKSTKEIQVAKISEEGIKVSLDDLLKNYAPITEKIIVEQVAIPFQTITKDASNDGTDTKNKVIQQGEDGIKEVTYKVKYQNNEEIERVVLSENIIKQPVDKIIQVKKKTTSRATTTSRAATTTENTTNASSGKSIGVYKITGYCSCAKCCGKATGRTASGTVATAGRTVAASGALPYGTKVNINGHTYTVEDRGGAIKGNKIDIYFSSHAQALAWGVKYLPVEIVN